MAALRSDKRTSGRHPAGFTLIELVVASGTLVLLAVLFLVTMPRVKAKSIQGVCVSNLKVICFGEIMWIHDSEKIR